MRRLAYLLCVGLCAVSPIYGVAADSEPGFDAFAQGRRQQEVSRMVLSPHGEFFIYEWQRPFGWNARPSHLEASVDRRPQTTMYIVATGGDWPEQLPPTSEELFPMAPGATYYLGSLSPDGRWVSFYELDRDRNALGAGVASTADERPRRVVRFSVPPDGSRLDRVASWESSGASLVYPIEGNRLARVNMATGIAVPCDDCRMEPFQTERSGHGLSELSREGIPGGAVPVGRSTDGSLDVFVLDNAQTLNLYFRRSRRVVTVFENARS
jgi:hypothetical protein